MRLVLGFYAVNYPILGSKKYDFYHRFCCCFLTLSMAFIVVLVILLMAGLLMVSRAPRKVVQFPAIWRPILEERVLFYHNLSSDQKVRFERDILRFLANVPVTGVQTTVDMTDKLLVASSAVIPVFGFPEWDYTFLDEVLLYPSSFDSSYQINSRHEVITGMVGRGAMEGKMILSKPALHRGFDTSTDKQNVGIHEFIHLLDKEDGSIDGIPATLQGREFSLPWMELIRQKTIEIKDGRSDIDAYAATSATEFFTVTGEYFFERPDLLRQKHPDLYELLAKAFNQNTAETLRITQRTKKEIGRNDPCPCGSGQKFKKCCGK
jgi:Mlc titration factor MtfA (ptsG expression regulator)